MGYGYGLPIPDDWDEGTDGFCTLTVTIPNSPKWFAVAKGALWDLSATSIWDEETGDPEQASQTAADLADTASVDCP